MALSNEQVIDALRTSLKENERLRSENRELVANDTEPIALVGMSCRYPGGIETPEDLWKLVESGGDAVSEFPADRGWDVERLFDPDPDMVGKSYTQQGGFLHDAGRFDADFFGISPREALAMDPQQRLLLEVAWEAFERAGIDPETMRGSATGVYAGVMYHDYASQPGSTPDDLEGYLGSGSAGSIASGRVAYVLGLEGPAVTVDTACSSSLVALHLAVQALRKGECTMALAGGVTVMSTPGTFVEFSRQRGLSADGRCKAFAAAADGTGWGEGVGMLLVERLSDAERYGHRVLGVIRGSAVNQDGASNGLTAPNGPSQQRVIRAALASASLSAADVDVVEAHGTGTKLGDPIEAQALIATYGQDRPANRPLMLGSLKSNIGHTQAAAGVAGVIKMIMAMRNGVMPRTLHIDEPSQHVDWSAGAVSLLTESVEWPVLDRPRRAGVSSFGFSGTNAHVILEQPEPETAAGQAIAGHPDTNGEAEQGLPAPRTDVPVPWVVSGRSAAAVGGQLVALAGAVSSGGAAGLPAVVGRALVTQRSSFDFRAGVVGRSVDELLAGLTDGVGVQGVSGVVSGGVASGGLGVVFPGQGVQVLGMGRGLYEAFPVFAGAFDEVCAVLDPLLGFGLREVLWAEPGSGSGVDVTGVAQPGLFAVEVALFRLWSSWGVRPVVVAGHSVGEIGAAWAAGVLSLVDACRLVVARAGLMQGLPPGGVMVAVSGSEADVAGVLGVGVQVAAVNGPGSVVLSGVEGDVVAAVGVLEGRGLRCRWLRVSHGFHSVLMDPMLDDFADAIKDIEFHPPVIAVVSTVTGERVDQQMGSAGYWVGQVRGSVRFADAVTCMAGLGVRSFLEVGPGGVLSGLIPSILDTLPDGGASVVVPSLRGADEALSVTSALASLHVHGVPVDWDAYYRTVHGVTGDSNVDLPTYAFQRERFWLQPAAGVGDVDAAGLTGTDHPLLGAVVVLPGDGGVVCTGRISVDLQPWLADHAVLGQVLLPGTALVELATFAGDQVGAATVRELTIEAPLVLPDNGSAAIRVVIGASDKGGDRPVAVYSQSDSHDTEWTRHATGLVSGNQQATGVDLTQWPPAGAEPVDTGAGYAELAERGYAYGPAFQGVRQIWRRGDEVFAEVELPADNALEATRYGVHPALLDAAMHALLMTDDSDETILPFAWQDVTIHATGAAAVRVRLTRPSPTSLSMDIADSAGTPVATVGSLTGRPVSVGGLSGGVPLFGVGWVEVEVPIGVSAVGVSAVGGGGFAGVVVDVSGAGAGAVDGGVAGGVVGGVRGVLGVVLEGVAGWVGGGCVGSLVVVTRGAVVVPGDVVVDVCQAPVWGLVRAVQGEHPGRVVVVDGDGGGVSAGLLASVVAVGEPEVAVRGGRVFVPRLSVLEPALAGAAGEVVGVDLGAGGGVVPVGVDLDLLAAGVVLVTGGTGGLGAVFARHLVGRWGVRHVVLVSRRGLAAPGAVDLVGELGLLGAVSVEVVAADVADRAALAGVIGGLSRPLVGVVHAAGVADNCLVGELSAERLAGVLAPKADAAWWLHELTVGLELAFFVVVSSSGGLVSAAGQGAYAAANTFVDGVAQFRRLLGLPAVSMVFGLWDVSTGLSAGLSVGDVARLRRQGLPVLSVAQGLSLFDAGLVAGPAVVVGLRVDRVALNARVDVVPAVLRGMLRVRRPVAGVGGSVVGGWVGRLAGLDVSARRALLLELVSGRVAAVLGYAAGVVVGADRAFSDLGFDSLSAVDLRNVLQDATGVRLPATLVFDYPTPETLAAYLDVQLGAGDATPATPIRAIAQSDDEAIAIVGMSCRYPGGVESPEDLWDLVATGTDAVAGFPTGRGWDIDGIYDADPDAVGKSYAKEGAFLYRADEFDADFFGISPREALAMDPQQRLLLETSWEAFERAGIDPATLRGSSTGVYAGVMYHDYGLGIHSAGTSGGSLVSGRISYVFGLEGPAVTVDTACSSSLVAMHLAAQALRKGECTLALAGGVTVMSTPGMFIEFSRQRGLAPDGRCKAFANSADGTGWGEGAAVLLMERLSDAQRNGHRVLGVIRGSAVNQDGASNGLTAPNGPSQQRVIRAALASAGLTPADVDVVEAHGTGTKLGDPIEAQALIATYGQDRPVDRPLFLGSLKSNIGHTQAASGVSGVIKMVMAMQHGVMPKTLHVDEPSQHVDWSAGAVTLLTEAAAWPVVDRPRRAAVSSFGISGTNAHVILEQPELVVGVASDSVSATWVEGSVADSAVDMSGVGSEVTAHRSDDVTVNGSDIEMRSATIAVADESPAPALLGAAPVPWVFSGRSEGAAKAQAARLADAVSCGRLVAEPAPIGRALVTQRSGFDFRAGVVGRSVDELVAGLTGGSGAVGSVSGRVLAGRLGVVFPGQGVQVLGMGRGLYEAFPVFAGAFDEVCAVLDPLLGFGLREVLWAEPGSGSGVDVTGVAQPGLFAVEVALFRLWLSWGVRPVVVAGHSVGEIGAAWAAGMLSLVDACRLVVARAGLMQGLPPGGVMVAVSGSEADVAGVLGVGVQVAAVNGPGSVVLSGVEGDVVAAVGVLEGRGLRCRWLRVSHGFHSVLMDPMLDDFADAIKDIEFHPPVIAVVSTVTGERVDQQMGSAGYWVGQVRGSVRFADAVTCMAGLGVRSFLEVGPGGVLSGLIPPILDTIPEVAGSVVVPSLRGADEALSVTSALDSLHVHGVPVDWDAYYRTVHGVTGAEHVDLPTYAFQRESYWLPAAVAATADVAAAGLTAPDHPLLGAGVPLPDSGGYLFTGRISSGTHPWLVDHVVNGDILLPATAFVELAVRAGDQVGAGLLEELTISTPLILSLGQAALLQVVLGAPDATGRRTVTIYSATDADDAWTQHAMGAIAGTPAAAQFELSQWPPVGAHPVDVSDLYESLRDIGYQYGPTFRGLQAAWRRGDELFAEVTLPTEQRTEAARYAIHPALLDATMHVLGISRALDETSAPSLPFAWQDVAVYATGAHTLRVRIVTDDRDQAAITLADDTGAPIASIGSLVLRPVSVGGLSGGVPLFGVGWVEVEVPIGVSAVGVSAVGGGGFAGVVVDVSGAGAGAVDGGVAGGVVGGVRGVLGVVLEGVAGWVGGGCVGSLVVVTRGAVVVPGDVVVDVCQAPVWGLVRAVQGEHPGRVVVVDGDGGGVSAGLLASVVAVGEPEVAVRGGRVFVPRLSVLEPALAGAAGEVVGVDLGAGGGVVPVGVDLDLLAAGVVLVTGGTGGLGAVFARHLVGRWGVRHVVLVSRRGLAAPGAVDLVGELGLLGAVSVEVVAADVADRAALAGVIGGLSRPLVGVVHAAGVADNCLVGELSAERLAGVLAPKADAAWWLHELTVGLELAFFVVVSSSGGLVSAAGQGAYAAANTFVDGVAQFRRLLGLPAVSMVFGLWDVSTGLSAGLSVGDVARLRRQGLPVLSVAQGLSLFDAGLVAGPAVVVGLRVDRVALNARVDVVPAVLRGMLRVRRPVAGVGGSVVGGWVGRLAGLDVSARRALLLELVSGRVAAVLGYAAGVVVGADRAFSDLGFDSLSAVDLRNVLQDATGVRLPATLVFDYPTPETLADFLLEQLLGQEKGSLPAVITAAADDDPIAIIGMSCHYPGEVNSPEDLWELLLREGDGITAFPTSRGWDNSKIYHPDPEHSGTSYARDGGFLHDADRFDADFFGIGRREALAMDPQQRLLLEASWEAFERAGINPATLRGSSTGVYAGVMYHDYASQLGVAPKEVEGYLGAGTAGSVASGRVSYSFGLEGPAVTVDTACSSSLVAMHLAAQALRGGECTLALAGGVTVMATPQTFVEFSRQRGLSVDGRCKAFAAAADGTGWAEGVGMLVLERSSDAKRNGHRVLGVIRGSAVNQDGASNGMTAPNGPSQQRVIRAALANAGLTPADVDVVEAHGTGTKLGDPIEAQALIATYGQDRPIDRPMWIGSVKSNLGHTQAAAGVAGVIKMIMAMQHGVMPRTLHVDQPSPHVDWAAGAVSLLTESAVWPVVDRPRRAAVSSFGLSGTNAHIILEQADLPDAVTVPTSTGAPVPWVISARSESALAEQASRLTDFALGAGSAPDSFIMGVGHSLALQRAGFDFRSAVVGRSVDELVAGLTLDSVGVQAASGAVSGRPLSGGLGVVFPGQGVQVLGMGRGLYGAFPVFAGAFDEVCAVLDPLLGFGLREVLWAEPGSGSGVDVTGVAQPGLFAVEVALFRLWLSWGVRPVVVAGHSVGEIGAAWAAGVLSLVDACRLVVARAGLMQGLPPGGVMVAVSGSEADVAGVLGVGVQVAAVNGPGSVVLSGVEGDVVAAVGVLEGRGLRCRWLRVSHGFHSVLMDPMLDDFADAIKDIEFHPPVIAVVSTVTGERVDQQMGSAGYWVGQVRGSVRFADAVTCMAGLGVRSFLEVGPGGVLSGLIPSILDTLPDGGASVVVPSLRGADEALSVTSALASLHVHGVPVDWDAYYRTVHGVTGDSNVDLPTYAFQRERFWLQPTAGAGDVDAAGLTGTDHPLLGAVVVLPGDGGVVCTGRISVDLQPWLADHAVLGQVLLPGTALVELATFAGDQVGAATVRELTIEAPLVLPDNGSVVIRVIVGALDQAGQRQVAVYSGSDGEDAEWIRHATGVLSAATPRPEFDLTIWPPVGAGSVDVDDAYETLAAQGYQYGPVFRGVTDLWRRGDEIFAAVQLPDTATVAGFALHPAVLDAAMHAVLMTENTGQTIVPFAWRGVSMFASGATAVRVRLTRPTATSLSLQIADPAGAPVASVQSLDGRVVTGLATALSGVGRSLFGTDWVPVQASSMDAPLERAVRVLRVNAAETESGSPAPVLEVLAGVQEFLAGDEPGPLVVVTTGAVSVSGDDQVDPGMAGVWGLLRSAQVEAPGRLLVLDIPTAATVPADVAGSDGVPVAGLAATAVATGEPQVAFRDGGCWAPRLVRVKVQPASESMGSGIPDLGDGRVLVTGGTGGLGAVVARHLVSAWGVKDLVLVSRRGSAAPGAADLVAELESLGTVSVQVIAADLADRASVADVIAGIGPDLVGVVHAAGVLDDGMLTALTADRVRGVWGPKAGAAWWLHELTADLDLALFVMFSSVAGVLGNPGQANYSAANAFLDGLALHRRSRGLAAQSLAWGLWNAGTDMSGQLGDNEISRMSRGGVLPLAVDDGLALLDTCVGLADANLVPAAIDLGAFVARPEIPWMLRGLVRPKRSVAQGVATGSTLSQRLASMTAVDRRSNLLELVRAQSAVVLGFPSTTPVGGTQAFTELGFDSMSALELRNLLQQLAGVQLPATLVFDYPTSVAVAGYLDVLLGGDEERNARQNIQITEDESIAIIGMSCRFPGGVSSPEDLWRLVESGGDAISDFPAERGWDVERLFDPNPETSGKSYTRSGGFLHEAAQFDAEFFGIGPREALAMDPQQRLLLESAWEAFERAGIDPGTLRGSDTGVYAGVMYHDYATQLRVIPEELEGYLGAGTAGSIASGRVSYAFGLEGPAVTVDTACSSSLVAMHLAGQSLRRGECSLALAGGVTVMATPSTFIEFSRQRGLSVDGRCKAFAASADGTGWAEGVGMLVLERLSDAERNGHRVLGVIRGSAVNQDGASNGLTAPNGPSQQRVIRAALASAGLSSADVDVVEAHGTGTKLGDPIEAQALIATYGQDRPADRPMWIGSVKSNLGHTQAAAGVAGVIKMVMAMQHGVMPRTLHVDRPSPHVDWSAGAVQLLTENAAWVDNDRPRRAAVSSFGLSGTNAHVILEQPAPEAAAEQGVPGLIASDVSTGQELSPARVDTVPVPWVVSGRSEGAVGGQLAVLAGAVSSGGAAGLPAVVGRALVLQRSSFDFRSVVVGRSVDELVAGLTASSAGVSGVSGGVASGGLGVVFPGQGVQVLGMGRGLYEAFPVFAGAFDEVCAVLDPLLGFGLREVLWAEPGSGSGVDVTGVAQPGLFAVEVALFRLWLSWGVRPVVVAGHSVGEIGAAWAAGVLSLVDACRLVVARAGLMQGLPPGGVMVAVSGSEADVAGVLGVGVQVAAVNGPGSVVLSGVEGDVVAAVGVLEGRGLRCRWLRVSHGFHSVLMDPMLDDFADAIKDIEFHPPVIAVVSTVTGERVDQQMGSAGYWVGQVRGSVRFADAVTCMAGLGVRSFLEVGPGGVLSGLIPSILDTLPDGGASVVVPSLRGADEALSVTSALASLHVHGVPVDWDAYYRTVHGVTGNSNIDLPTYAFQHQEYWLRSAPSAGDVTAAGLTATDHPLLGAGMPLPDSGGYLFTGRLSLAEQPWLADHVVADTVIVPGTVLVELAFCAGDQVGCGQLDELTLQAPLVVPERAGVRVQLAVGSPDETGRRSITIYSCREDADDAAGDGWTRHGEGVLAAAALAIAPEDPFEVTSWPPAGAENLDVSGLYDELAGMGNDYGPTFRGLRAAWRHGGQIYAEIGLPAAQHSDAARFGVHPALLDAAQHTIALLGDAQVDGDEGGAKMPFSWTGVRLLATGATALRVRLTSTGPESVRLDAADESGRAVASIDSLVLRTVDVGTGARRADESIYRVDWNPMQTGAAQPIGDCAVIGAPWPALDSWSASANPENAHHATVDSFVAALDVDGSTPDQVLLGLPCSAEGLNPGAATTVVAQTLDAIQRCLADDRLSQAGIVVLTQGAVAARDGEQVRDLPLAAVWGLIRTAQSENPGRITVIDTDGTDNSFAVLSAVITGDEPQVALRDGSAFVPRLARTGRSADARTMTLQPPDGASAWRLDTTARGSLDNLALVACPEVLEPLGPGQVRVGVRAAGMNFRDVVAALDLIEHHGAVGLEGAGVITEMGSDVTGFTVGDRVMGLFSGSFGPVAVCDYRLLARIPKGWTFAQAAAAPLVFLTAYYALVDLARLAPGEKLLIHAATGGVGTAAVQLARHLGAEVYGTASPAKWPALRSLGVADEHIASSRDLGFLDTFLDVTGGDGMDVVLNSLTLDFVDTSLRALPRGGRFIEMGKTDIRDAAQVQAAHPGVSYQAFDLRTDAGRDRIQEMFAELLGLVELGVLSPLPVTAWDVREGPRAFRYLSQAQHIGKVVLTVPRQIDSQGTILITGGTGVLGGIVARHLASEYGVKNFVLTSRSGPAAPGAVELVDSLQALGADARVVTCDAADRAALADLLATIPADRPLTAVIHAAGVVSDAPISSMTERDVRAVMGAKATAATNLHELTLDLDLAAFVCFSSVSGTLGGPAQANYAAANHYLDALAGQRSARGLPATSMAWGMWAERTGLTSHLADGDVARMSRGGLLPLTTEEGLAMFDEALGRSESTLIMVRLDIAALRDQTRMGVPPLLRGLLRAPSRRSVNTGVAATSDLQNKLAALVGPQRDAALLELVQAEASVVLGHGQSVIGAEDAFKDVGFDSLSAVELRNRLGAACGVRLPATLIFDYPNPSALAQFLSAQLPTTGGEQQVSVFDELDRLEARLGEISVDELDQSQIATRLRALLTAWQDRDSSFERLDEDELEAATDDELFALVDNQFGTA